VVIRFATIRYQPGIGQFQNVGQPDDLIPVHIAQTRGNKLKSADSDDGRRSARAGVDFAIGAKRVVRKAWLPGKINCYTARHGCVAATIDGGRAAGKSIVVVPEI